MPLPLAAISDFESAAKSGAPMNDSKLADPICTFYPNPELQSPILGQEHFDELRTQIEPVPPPDGIIHEKSPHSPSLFLNVLSHSPPAPMAAYMLDGKRGQPSPRKSSRVAQASPLGMSSFGHVGAEPLSDIAGLSVDQVATRLAEAGLAASYVKMLHANGLDGKGLLELDEQKLEAMGIRLQVVRNTIMFNVDQICGRGHGLVVVEPHGIHPAALMPSSTSPSWLTALSLAVLAVSQHISPISAQQATPKFIGCYPYTDVEPTQNIVTSLSGCVNLCKTDRIGLIEKFTVFGNSIHCFCDTAEPQTKVNARRCPGNLGFNVGVYSLADQTLAIYGLAGGPASETTIDPTGDPTTMAVEPTIPSVSTSSLTVAPQPTSSIFSISSAIATDTSAKTPQAIPSDAPNSPFPSSIPTQPTDQQTGTASNPGLTAGAIAGIVIGILIIGVGVAALFFYRRRASRKTVGGVDDIVFAGTGPGPAASFAVVRKDHNNSSNTGLTPGNVVYSPVEPNEPNASQPLSPPIQSTGKQSPPPKWQTTEASTETSMFEGVDSKKKAMENEMPIVRLTVTGPPMHPSKEAQVYRTEPRIHQSFLPSNSTVRSDTVLASAERIEGWTTDQVVAALAEAGVAPNYVAILNKNMVNGYLLLRLTDEELEGMGVRSQTARNMILYAVDQIRGRGEVVRSVETLPREDLPQYAAI
ncbi:hypothetical protein HDU97_010046 [Phlyctochytrium planicorne]|nr:hypothetical protein HDU97_010046 [Phlyctochytrium planicorne]